MNIRKIVLYCSFVTGAILCVFMFLDILDYINSETADAITSTLLNLLMIEVLGLIVLTNEELTHKKETGKHGKNYEKIFLYGSCIMTAISYMYRSTGLYSKIYECNYQVADAILIGILILLAITGALMIYFYVKD